MAKSHLKLVTPIAKKRTVRPRRPPNADLRTREYLTEAEVERLTCSSKPEQSDLMPMLRRPVEPAAQSGH